MINPSTVSSDEDLARSILVLARTIAPCIDSFADESDELKNTLAILKRVANEAVERGSRQIVSHGAGTTEVKYRDSESWFSSDDRAALRSLCATAAIAPGLPMGSFPISTSIGHLWPEEY